LSTALRDQLSTALRDQLSTALRDRLSTALRDRLSTALLKETGQCRFDLVVSDRGPFLSLSNRTWGV